jgi:hypothetical protein
MSNPNPSQGAIKPLGLMVLAGLFALSLLALFIFSNSYGNVENGTYVVKQTTVSGELVAYMKPGWYPKWFGTITVFPVAETFYFTKDSEGVGSPSGSTGDDSIEVRFNDGATCNISGTCRVDLPRSPDEAIALITKFGYRDHNQVETKLILPVIRRALIMTANLMSSKESYSDRRADFFKWAWDQIQNGVYQTKDEEITELDPITGQQVTHVRKTILTDKDGKILHDQNPLDGTGITLSIFEVKNFVYDSKVQAQISTQQEAIMAVQTARAKAQQAEQDALTAEANGKAAVMKAQYEELEKKTRATVNADQAAAVAVIAAQQEVDVASKAKETSLTKASQDKEVAAVELETAKLKEEAVVETARGEAEARRLILASDGALKQKLETYTAVQKVWADAFARHQVPTMQIAAPGGAGGGTNDAQMLMELLTVKAARDLSLDLTVPRTASSAETTTP